MPSSFQSRSRARQNAQLAQYAHNLRHSRTASEQILWTAIRGRVLGVQFRGQVPIGGLFMGDLVASMVGLLVEVDGSSHAHRATRDACRDTKLQRLGFTVLRLPTRLVERKLPVALQCIREAIASSAARRLSGFESHFLTPVRTFTKSPRACPTSPKMRFALFAFAPPLQQRCDSRKKHAYVSISIPINWPS